MADMQTLARPYAKAVFELARDGSSLPQWSEVLSGLATVVAQPDIASLLDHPKVGSVTVGEKLVESLGDKLDAAGGNLVRLLASNGRLAALSAIAEEYEALRSGFEQRIDVQITAASEVPDANQQAISSALAARLKQEVNVEVSVDESLIAGAIIKAGDLVIDGSMKSELEQMGVALA